MIGYFLKSGDEGVSKMFSPYVWEERGFDTLFKKSFSNKQYGKGLKLLLIMYYVEGEFGVNGPDMTKVSNYSVKNQDISVSITVRAEMFHDRNEFERREFIVDSSLSAIQLVQEKLSKKKLNIKFNELMSDVKEVGNMYLKQASLIR
jgi:hypothetical protein